MSTTNDKVDGIIEQTKKDPTMGFLKAALLVIVILASVAAYLFLDTKQESDKKDAVCDKEKEQLQKQVYAAQEDTRQAKAETVAILQKVAADLQRKSEEQDDYNRQVYLERVRNNKVIKTLKDGK